jgi:ATP-binding cassette subfamily B multidrug efflux pump
VSNETNGHRGATNAGQTASRQLFPRPRTAGPGSGPRMTVGMPVERSENFRATTRRLFGRMSATPGRMALVLGLALVGVSMQVVGPKLLGRGTDVIVEGLRGPGGIDFGRLERVLALLTVLYLAAWLCTWLQARILAGLVQGCMQRLRADVEDKLHRVPLSYVDRAARGDLLSRVTNDIDNLAQALQQTLHQILASILTLTGVLIMMIWISPLLSLIAVVGIPLSLGLMRAIAARSRTRFIAQWGHTGALNAHVEEVFTGHSVVKAFGRQREVETQFRATNDDLYRASFGAQFISGVIQPTMMLVGNLTFVAVAVLGGLRVASGAMTIGDVQAFLQYSRQFAMPLTQLASLVNLFQSGIASAERVFELLDAEEQSSDAGAAPTSATPAGRVAFEHVTFSYDPAKPLIDDLSLVAEPGQTIAIVGPTGAGKTTLVNLLMRFYELDGGRITLDGRDIATMRRADLRASFGMVLQDTWLFGGTIRDNIAYGRPGAADDEVTAAAAAAYVDRIVLSLPHGYDTVIEDDGGNLSAGERQLITIARAFLADPAILILDEATSSVDTRTEVLVQGAMAALRTNRTSFVIAHRLSTIRDADVILVMDAGRIVEQGSHQELLALGGAYHALYNAQFAAPAAEVT